MPCASAIICASGSAEAVVTSNPAGRTGTPGVRRLLRVMAAAAVILASVQLGWSAETAVPADGPAQVAGVVAVGMTVRDATRSTAFFHNVLGFEKVADFDLAGAAYDRLWGLTGARAHVVRLRLGAEVLELIEFASPKGRSYPARSRSNDRWFQHVAIVVGDMDAAYARVRPHVQPISTRPQILPPSNRAAAGIAAFYFRDPDGHPLELIHFPPGKGDPRWQAGGGRLFLGVDHTAIGVGATAASLGFYRDALGLRVAGESHNVGREQARLTGVAGADVRITGLRPPREIPGVELLEYTAPRDGRPAPQDTRVTDVVHWRTIVAVDDVAAAAAALRRRGYLGTGNDVTLPDGALGYTHAALVADPDGHALELVAP
jgi:catechol 2,3-dioxygenase-like lactoylglutathione lyase family enzyme